MQSGKLFLCLSRTSVSLSCYSQPALKLLSCARNKLVWGGHSYQMFNLCSTVLRWSKTLLAWNTLLGKQTETIYISTFGEKILLIVGSVSVGNGNVIKARCQLNCNNNFNLQDKHNYPCIYFCRLKLLLFTSTTWSFLHLKWWWQRRQRHYRYCLHWLILSHSYLLLAVLVGFIPLITSFFIFIVQFRTQNDDNRLFCLFFSPTNHFCRDGRYEPWTKAYAGLTSLSNFGWVQSKFYYNDWM